MTSDQNWEKIEIKTILRSSYHLLPLQKQYQNPILLLHWDYFNHISAIYVQNFAYISPIYDPFIILIKAIFQSFEFGKISKIKTSPPHLKVIRILNCGLFIFGAIHNIIYEKGFDIGYEI